MLLQNQINQMPTLFKIESNYICRFPGISQRQSNLFIIDANHTSDWLKRKILPKMFSLIKNEIERCVGDRSIATVEFFLWLSKFSFYVDLTIFKVPRFFLLKIVSSSNLL